MTLVRREHGVRVRSRTVGIVSASRRRRSDAFNFLDNRPDPKAMLDGMAIAKNVERFRRQAPRDGMLGCDGERFDKLIKWESENVPRANSDPDTRVSSKLGKQR